MECGYINVSCFKESLIENRLKWNLKGSWVTLQLVSMLDSELSGLVGLLQLELAGWFGSLCCILGQYS